MMDLFYEFEQIQQEEQGQDYVVTCFLLSTGWYIVGYTYSPTHGLQRFKRNYYTVYYEIF